MKLRGCLILGLLLLLFFLGGLGVIHLLAPPAILLTGWIPAGLRYLRDWHPPGTMASVSFVGAMMVLIVGTHGFLVWLRSSWSARTDGADNPAAPWRPKWTLSGFGIGFCVLIAVTSVMLTTHQVYWLSRTDEPWFMDRLRGLRMIHRTADQLLRLAEKNEWNVDRVGAAFLGTNSYSRDIPIWELVQPVWVEGDSNMLKAVILVPRTGAITRPPASFAVVERGGKVKMEPMEKLPSVMATFGVRAGVETNQPPGLLP